MNTQPQPTKPRRRRDRRADRRNYVCCFTPQRQQRIVRRRAPLRRARKCNEGRPAITPLPISMRRWGSDPADSNRTTMTRAALVSVVEEVAGGRRHCASGRWTVSTRFFTALIPATNGHLHLLMSATTATCWVLGTKEVGAFRPNKKRARNKCARCTAGPMAWRSNTSGAMLQARYRKTPHRLFYASCSNVRSPKLWRPYPAAAVPRGSAFLLTHRIISLTVHDLAEARPRTAYG